MPPPQDIDDLRFPLGGVDRTDSFGRQPAREIGDGVWVSTTRSAQNVRACDPRSLRLRGGQRPSLIKFFPTPVVAGWLLQELAATVKVEEDVVQLSNYGRIVDVVAVSKGNVYYARPGDLVWTAATNLAATAPPLNFTGVMNSSQCIQKLWFADGAHWRYYDPLDNTVRDWVASAGFLPEASDGSLPRLICTWRGRIVLSGVIGDPQNWFMSAVNDPTDFDYAPLSPSPTQAVAGNNASQGLVGDVITCLIPYSDDVLIFGSDHEIRMMRGDPMAGGQIDLITDAIGMAWGSPWCKDPDGRVYFLSNRTGIFMLKLGSAPIRISNQIEKFLQAIDTGASTIRLLWDDRYQGLHVFISPTEEPAATTNFFYEVRTGAWWPDKFKNVNHQPLCCIVVDGNGPDDRVPLLGSWDGYVRTFSPDVSDDDGTEVESEVWLGPILTKDLDDVLFREMQAVLGEESGDVSFAVHVGRTAEAAIASPPAVSGTWKAGRNPTELVNASGYALYVKLTATTPWAMEAVRAIMKVTGRVRRRGR